MGAVSVTSLPISVSVIVVPIFFATDLVGRYTLLLQTGVITKLDGWFLRQIHLFDFAQIRLNQDIAVSARNLRFLARVFSTAKLTRPPRGYEIYGKRLFDRKTWTQIFLSTCNILLYKTQRSIIFAICFFSLKNT